MHIAVFGATGQTGLQLVQQALQAGHEVVAFARNPSKLGISHERLHSVQGDISDKATVTTAIQGANAVVSALGPSSNKPDFAVSQGMTNILSAMQQHNVRRLVISAGAGVRDPQDNPKLVDRFFGIVLRLVSGNVVADMEKTVALVRASDRDWTVVRVPRLTNGPATGQYKIGYVGDIGTQITRADLAAFMLRQLSDTQFVRAAPAISN
jgi:putative NADH-flavin reductase